MELLEKYFDTAFAASDGIKKLRESIMTLAMQGKLLPQNLHDEPTESLIQKNRKLIFEATGGKQKKVPDLHDAKVEIPAGWIRCQLSDVALVVMGNSPPGNTYNDHGDGIPLINGPVEFSPGAFGPTLRTKYTTAPSRLCQKDDLIVCVRGATTGRTNVSAFEACIGRGVALVRGWAAQPYLNYLFLRLGQKLLEQGKGTTFPSISYSDLAGLEIWLPPLAEQRRIVAKVDQLMARCDELEKLRAERDRLKITVHKAACDRLLTAPDTATFTQSWQFITQHFSELYTVKENVAQLRKAILQLAVMGKLVPQNPNDPSAQELLKEIDTEKERLLKEKKIRAPIVSSKIESMEVPHLLPTGWQYMRLGDFGYILGGGTPNKSDGKCWNGTIPWIRPKNMKVDYISDSQDRISDFALSKSTVKLIPENSLLMVVRGMILAHSFPAALTTAVVTINQDMKALCPYVSSTANYLLLSTKGRKDYFLGLIERSSHGTCRLETSKLFSTVLAVPPLLEQHRIVAKVDQLMTLCDTLEQQIDATTQKQTALLDAVIAQL